MNCGTEDGILSTIYDEWRGERRKWRRKMCDDYCSLFASCSLR